MFKELVKKNRSTRRFRQEIPVEMEILRELVDLARMTPTARNAQALKYILANTPERNALIFPHLTWAGYLKDWGGPAEGERPSAYIIILGDKGLSQAFGVDPGIVAQTMLLGAVDKGFSGVMINSVRRKELQAALRIPAQFEIQLVIALGIAAETIVIEPIGPDGDIQYWRDRNGIHHVPKRYLDDLIVNLE